MNRSPAISADAANIRQRRQASNAAIAAHDAAAVAAIAREDVCVTTSAGAVFVGREALRARFEAMFARTDGVVFHREPDSVVVSHVLPHAAEHGQWTGRWREGETKVEIGGPYSAVWTKIEGVWLIRSEIFVQIWRNASPMT